MYSVTKIRMRFVLLILVLYASPVTADTIRVAVASNFTQAIRDVAGLFEQRTGHRVVLAFGSTGKHYAQIRNGAPFDAFFAADARRPGLLEDEGLARPGSRFTYALGKLVLWSPDPARIDGWGRVLASDGFRHLAIANPKLAPYGRAAQQVMQALGVWQRLKGRLVRGENVGQAFQFVKSGNAQMGFVAMAQVKQGNRPVQGSYWQPPQSLYTPIEQQAVLLRDDETARAFLAFAQGDEARAIIAGYGYGVP